MYGSRTGPARTVALAGGLLATLPAIADSTLPLACLGCHQPAVNAPEMPALDRLSVAAIAASLRRSRDQPFAGSVMARLTAKMSDAEIDALADALGRRGPP